MTLYLLIVVQEADHAEHQREQQHIDVAPVPCQHAGPAGGKNGDRNAGNKHQSAHSGRTGLGGVPLGPHLPDGLPRLQTAQGGQNDLSADDACDGKTEETRENHFHENSPSVLTLCQALSFR